MTSTESIRANREVDSPGSPVFWWAFAIYAAITILWLTLSIGTLLSKSLLPSAMAEHTMAGAPEHAEDLILSVGTLVLGLFLIWLAPTNITARAFAVGLVGTAIGFSITAHHLLDAIWPGSTERFSLTPISVLHVIFHLIAGSAYAFGLLLFPDGKLPPISRRSLLGLIAVILTSLVVLVVVGREPPFFILFCGVAVVIAGIFSQWLKSRSPDPVLARQSRNFLQAFLIGLGVATALGLSMWALDWQHFISDLKDPQGAHAWTFGNMVFASVPPLLAGTAVVVFVGILQYRLWGVDEIRHKPRLFAVLMVVVIGIYVGATVAVHEVTLKLGDKLGIGVLLSTAAAVMASMFVLEKPRDSMERVVNRLVYGTPINPYRMQTEFSSAIATTISTEAVVSALASELKRNMNVVAGRLTVALTAGERSFTWPPSASNPPLHISLPLSVNDESIGALSLAKANSSEFTDPERALAHDLGTVAALAVKTRIMGTAADSVETYGSEVEGLSGRGLPSETDEPETRR
jgi:hypothetical protein